MKKDKKVKNNVKTDKKTKMELSKNVFDVFLQVAGKTNKSNIKTNKKK